MEIRSIGFVGGGRVVRILVTGWQRTGTAAPAVCVCEPEAQAREALTLAGAHLTVVDSVTEVAGQDLVVLAVHPPAIGEVLSEVGARLRPDALVLSLAPKVTLAAIRDALGGFPRVARMIPNAPSAVGRGFNPVCFGPDVDAATRTSFLELLAPLGETPEVAEDTLEAYAILTAMGPTYLWFQLQTLREIGRELGLPGEAADSALRAMVEGTLATLLDSGLPPAAVMDLIPVRPLQGEEERLQAAYHTALLPLHARLRPTPTR